MLGVSLSPQHDASSGCGWRNSLQLWRVQFVSDKMSYIILRGRWCQVIVLNVHAPTEDKTDDVKDSFYEELERV
jgi:hypothetical protein